MDYRPLSGMSEVLLLPLRCNGYVTFETFNRFSKASSLTEHEVLMRSQLVAGVTIKLTKVT